MAKVRSISIYPVKSLRGISLPAARVEPEGLAHDRRWMIVDASGRFKSQREHAILARVETSLDGDTISLRFQGRTVSFGTEEYSDSLPVSVWKSELLAFHVRADVDQFLSEVLEEPVRLVAKGSSTRTVSAEFPTQAGVVSFADGYPLLVANQASLDDLNSRLDEPVPMDRFRANVVVDGLAAFEEDSWQSGRLGSEVELEFVKPCGRCQVVTIDQESGSKTGPEPLTALAEFRKVDNKVNFGVNASALRLGTISVGDSFEVLARV